MTNRMIGAMVATAVVPIALGGLAAAAQSGQDKYALRIPDGLAFSEFRGYETWPVVSSSHTDETLNVIVANPVMMNAYQNGFPANGQPWPDGARIAKLQYLPRKSSEAPFNVAIPDVLKDVAFMAKDGKRFADSGGWGYGVFLYDRGSDTFRPEGMGYKCGTMCHTAVKAKDYVFTRYEKR